MHHFKEIPISKKLLTKRKLVYNIGINNADYLVKYKIDGKYSSCPYYQRWKSMIMRCYSSRYQEKYPTYIGCTVSESWLTFSNFKEWMIKQDWQGKDLDKDIIIRGNKVYSPYTCCFISSKLNNLLTGCDARRGDYPKGVYFDKQKGKYKAQCCYNGTKEHLGRFDTISEAEYAYIKRKREIILESAREQTDERIKNGLMHHIQ